MTWKPKTKEDKKQNKTKKDNILINEYLLQSAPVEIPLQRKIQIAIYKIRHLANQIRLDIVCQAFEASHKIGPHRTQVETLSL